MKDWLSIGQFSKRTGVSARALRLYEKMGLIESASRGENGYRYYREDQISVARKIRELKTLGFSLKEICSLLKFDTQLDMKSLGSLLKHRLNLILQEEKLLGEQKDQIKSILSSLNRKTNALSERERKYVMDLFKKATIVVTGVEDLDKTATYIKDHFTASRQDIQIIQWNESLELSDIALPVVIIIPESKLTTDQFKNLKPDVIVVKNVGSSSKKTIDSYLRLFSHVGPHMATVLNADDRASIEIAKSPLVQKGKIYYFSKNTGLKDQIKKIGGTISDGEEITVYGFNDHKSGNLNIKIKNIRAHDEEVALIAALTAVMDLGMKVENIALTV
ncbi:MAG: MerR family transcriptional regulator [Bdellovibrionales bacterium]|nr:MerR family transcriptional regulator [Bdellovibrionales bacterium]